MTRRPPSTELVDRIRTGHLTMHSKLSLLAERLGLDSIGLLLLFVAALAVNLVIFWLRANDALAWFGLGSLGTRAFFEAFPYVWLAGATLAFVAIASILHRLSLRAKPTPRWILGALMLSGIGLGSTAAFFDVNERILEPDASPSVQRLQRFYTFTSHHGRSGIVGTVIRVTPEVLELQVQGQLVRVVPPDGAFSAAQLSALEPGDRLLIVSQAARETPVRAASMKKLRRVPQPPMPRVNVRIVRPTTI